MSQKITINHPGAGAGGRLKARGVGNHFPEGTTPTTGRAQSQHWNLNLRVQTLGGGVLLVMIKLLSLENGSGLGSGHTTTQRHSPFLHILILLVPLGKHVIQMKLKPNNNPSF